MFIKQIENNALNNYSTRNSRKLKFIVIFPDTSGGDCKIDFVTLPCGVDIRQ